MSHIDQIVSNLSGKYDYQAKVPALSWVGRLNKKLDDNTGEIIINVDPLIDTAIFVAVFFALSAFLEN